MSDEPLLIAVPSKGRLQENAFAFFARSGLPLAQSRGVRDYRAAIAGLTDVEVLFLASSEIVQRLGEGSVHLGVCGEDLLREEIPDADGAVALLAPLGFGQANVVVAAPQAWIDVHTMADLDDVAADWRQRHRRRLRVATKYGRLTRRWFASHGLADYEIVESAGATEGAPAAGIAEIIVDITTTGATLAANGLKVLDDGVILKSEANLVAGLRAPWSAGSRAAARRLLARVAAAEAARGIKELRVGLGSAAATSLIDLATAAGATAAFGAGSGSGLVLHCPAADAAALAERLVAAGAGPVSVASAEFVFRGGNALVERLEARLAAGARA
jgi:ATP phosphoribosyltransferase